jgi:hypothetical protein
MFWKLGKGGFTITEMSLALVMGGLLMGGVIKGENLVEGFQLRVLMNDLQGISAAYNAYYNRYNALPGDDARVHSWAGVTAGNSNGVIEGSSTRDGSEAHEAWQSLRYTGLISGDPWARGRDVLPLSPYGGPYELCNRNFGARFGKKNCVRVTKISGSAAEVVDATFDDGRHNTGRISASASYKSDQVDLYYSL